MTGEQSKSETVKSQGRGRSNSLPANVVEYLKAWLMSPEHINHPYPTEKEKAQMVADTGIELKRLNNWFVNNRIRYWKPRMEALQKQQQEERTKSSDSVKAAGIVSPEQTKAKTNWFERVAKIVPDTQDESKSPKSLLPHPPRLTHPVSDSSTAASDDSSSSDDGNVSDGSFSANYSTVFEMKQSKSLRISAPSIISRKRGRCDDVLLSPRSKYSRKNVDLWKSACIASPRLNDENLPTLDEAACLFGYASDQ